MADSCAIQKTGTVVGVIHIHISVFIVIASITAIFFGNHWAPMLVLIATAVVLFFAAKRFIIAIKSKNSVQTIFFIGVSIFLLIVTAVYFYLFLEGFVTGEFSGKKYIYYSSPIALLFQLFTTYVSFNVYQKLSGAAPQSNA